MADRFECTDSSGGTADGSASVEVVPLTDRLEDEWNSFVEESWNGTEFHRTDFLAYHLAGRFCFRHLMFYLGPALVSVLPGAVDGRIYRSPSGASMGGFVLAHGTGLRTVTAVVDSFVEWCRKESLDEAYIGPPMPVYRRLPDESAEFALLRSGFFLRGIKYSSVTDLSLVGDRSRMPVKTRNNIRRSEKAGIRIAESDDFEAFYPILRTSKMKYGCSPTHSLEELHRIRELRPDLIRLFLAFHGDVPAAGLMLFLASPACVLNFYTAQDYRYHRFNPVSLLVEYSMGWARSSGYRYYDYGVSMDTDSADPMAVSWPLVRFKESLGLTGCIRKLYHRKF